LLNKIEKKINDIDDDLDDDCELKNSDNINNVNKDEIVSLNQLENNLT